MKRITYFLKIFSTLIEPSFMNLRMMTIPFWAFMMIIMIFTVTIILKSPENLGLQLYLLTISTLLFTIVNSV